MAPVNKSSLARAKKDPLLKAKHKLEKKLQFFDKKRRRSRRRDQKAFDLSTLAEFLPEIASSRTPTPTTSKLKCKSRQKLVVKEAEQLKAVIGHLVFQSDPVFAIHQHLKSTIRPQIDPLPAWSKDRTKKSGGRKLGKKNSKDKKIQPMEISGTG